jgi:hypothetical protein
MNLSYLNLTGDNMSVFKMVFTFLVLVSMSYSQIVMVDAYTFEVNVTNKVGQELTVGNNDLEVIVFINRLLA